MLKQTTSKENSLKKEYKPSLLFAEIQRVAKLTRM